MGNNIQPHLSAVCRTQQVCYVSIVQERDGSVWGWSGGGRSRQAEKGIHMRTVRVLYVQCTSQSTNRPGPKSRLVAAVGEERRAVAQAQAWGKVLGVSRKADLTWQWGIIRQVGRRSNWSRGRRERRWCTIRVLEAVQAAHNVQSRRACAGLWDMVQVRGSVCPGTEKAGRVAVGYGGRDHLEKRK